MSLTIRGLPSLMSYLDLLDLEAHKENIKPGNIPFPKFLFSSQDLSSNSKKRNFNLIVDSEGEKASALRAKIPRLASSTVRTDNVLVHSNYENTLLVNQSSQQMAGINKQGNKLIHKISFPYGDYEGECFNNVPHGKGKCIFNGGIYEGNFVDGKFHGKGKLTSVDGEEYEGDFVYGVGHGTGKFIRADGEKYEGEFVNGKGHGKGKLTKANGSIYEGDFAYGRFHGTGKFISIKGFIYEGKFANGKYQGTTRKTLTMGNLPDDILSQPGGDPIYIYLKQLF